MFKICSKCRINLHVERYHKLSASKAGIRPACKDCTASSRDVFRDLVCSARYRQKFWNAQNCAKSCEFDIDHEFLRELYSLQRGKCVYSGIDMSLIVHSHWKMSLERLNPDIGYRKDNVALIVFELNTAAQMTIQKNNKYFKINFIRTSYLFL
eukprot:215707_1